MPTRIYPPTDATVRPYQWTFAGLAAPVTIGTDLYVLTDDLENWTLSLWKSTDAGATWTVQDKENAPAYSAEALQLIQQDATLWALYVVRNGSAYQFAVAPFDTDTGLWGAPVLGGAYASGGDAADQAQRPDNTRIPACLDADGQIWMFHCGGADATDAGVPSTTIAYAVFDTGTSAWVVSDAPGDAIADAHKLPLYHPANNDPSQEPDAQQAVYAVADGTTIHVISLMECGSDGSVEAVFETNQYGWYGLVEYVWNGSSWDTPVLITLDLYGNSGLWNSDDHTNYSPEYYYWDTTWHFNGAGAIVGVPTAARIDGALQIAVPYWRNTYAEGVAGGSGTMGVAIGANGSWTVADVSSTPPLNRLGSSFYPSAAVWMESSGTLPLLYTEGPDPDTQPGGWSTNAIYADAIALDAGLHVYWVGSRLSPTRDGSGDAIYPNIEAHKIYHAASDTFTAAFGSTTEYQAGDGAVVFRDLLAPVLALPPGPETASVSCSIAILPESAEVSCSISITGPANTGLWLDLWIWRVLWSFTDPRQSLAFLPGYEKALRLALAVELCRAYPHRNPGPIRLQLQAALGALEANNTAQSKALEELPPPETQA